MMAVTDEGNIRNSRESVLKRLRRMESHKFTLALTCLNLAVAVIVLSHSVWDKPIMADSQQIPKVIRAQAIELVSERGQVRSRLNVEPDGEVVLRLLDKNGTIRVKLGAGEDGSGLLLLDEATEPGIHMIARRSGTAAKPTTTSISLKRVGGQQRVIKP